MADLAWCCVEEGPTPRGLTRLELLAIGEIWKRQRSEITARFGGTSMRPTIEPQDELLIRCGESVGTNDIAVFVFGDRLVVHRAVIALVGESWVLTQGDAHLLPDPFLVDRAAVIGVVRGRRESGRIHAIAGPPSSLRRSLILGICRVAAASGRRMLQRVIGVVRRIHAIRGIRSSGHAAP